MLKRILVVLDGSEASEATRKLAVRMAKEFNADLTGVGIIDTPWITAAQPEPLGGAAYKIHRDYEVIKQTRARIKEMLAEYSAKCKKDGVSCTTVALEGFPATEIEKLSQEHDLILIGRTTGFHFGMDEDSDLTVKHVTRDNPRPVIVVTSADVRGDTVLIAYDGSMQAARALQMYLLLGLAENKRVHILSIGRKQKEADAIAERAHKMCESHGAKVTSEGVASSKPPEEIIKKKSDEVNAVMIVMGAFGHHGLRELFFGSCTEHMMKASKAPLFIHH